MTVFRHLSALAAVLLLAVGHSSAQTSVENFFTAPDDAVITVINDADHPWTINEDGVLMSNMHEDNGSTSIIFINNSGRDLWCTVELSVSSEENYDYLNFYNDNNLINGISGEVASYTERFLFRNGEQISFTYSKDGSQSRGSDCGYIKSLSFSNSEYDCNDSDWEITPNADGHTASVTEYLGNSEYVEIPSTITKNGVEYTITAIGSYLFNTDHSYAYNIKGAVIPSTVTQIGDRAFDGCNNLTSIEIPSSVTSIGYEAFAVCYNLTSIEIPSSVTSIGNYAFGSCIYEA